jgi:hypothetical protein
MVGERQYSYCVIFLLYIHTRPNHLVLFYAFVNCPIALVFLGIVLIGKARIQRIYLLTVSKYSRDRTPIGIGAINKTNIL